MPRHFSSYPALGKQRGTAVHPVALPLKIVTGKDLAFGIENHQPLAVPASHPPPPDIF